MSEAGKFLIYCIELYRRAKHIDGRTAYELFHSTGADDYVPTAVTLPYRLYI